MCSPGRAGWLMLDSETCFAGPDLAMRTCYCPLATCMQTTSGHYQCMYTSLTIAIAVVLVVLWLSGLAVYWYASTTIDDASLKSVRPQHKLSRVSDVLFGVYHASDLADLPPPPSMPPVAASEKTALVGAASGMSKTGHGTF